MLFFFVINVSINSLPIGNSTFGLNKFNVKAISLGLSNIGVADNKTIRKDLGAFTIFL